MLGLCFEVRTQCGRCGQALPLNACTERVTCTACQQVTVLDAARWKSLLEDAFAGLADLEVSEGKNVTIMTSGMTFQLMYGHQPPRCAACKTPVPDVCAGFAGFADKGWKGCPGCGARVSLRAAPPVLAALGAKYVVGEDFGQLGGAPGPAPQKPSPVVLHCPQCQAPLSVDGSDRMVKCQYCKTDVYLPDDLWLRLHPAVTVGRWYAWLADVDLAARKLASFRWDALASSVLDARGNVYCAGEDSASDRFAVWCMGTDLAVRWVRDGLEFGTRDARLALDPRGRLLLWESGKASVTVLSAADGSTLGKLGGREPEGATCHYLDVSHGNLLMGDVDGTILGLLGERLVRFGEDGSARATWPPRAGMFGTKAEKLRPLYGPGHSLLSVDGVYVENLGHCPTEVDNYTRLCIGWDGRLYAERSQWVACFDRAGERVYRVQLPVDDVYGKGIATDRAGQLYVLCTRRGDPATRLLLRVAPDASRVDTLATDQRTGGVLGDEDHLLVTVDGTILLLDPYMRSRMLGPDGRMLRVSDTSREKDMEERKAIAARG
jgi:hypothetical protein